MKRLIPYLINQQIAGRECELTHGLQQKDFLYVDDAAKGFVTAIERFDSLKLHCIYNLCSGIPSSLRSVGERIVRLMHGNAQLFRWGVRPARAAEPSFIVGDPSLFMSTTGWQPQMDLDLGLSRTILYHRQLAGRSSSLSSHKAQSAAA